jgi:hypothetical protein
MSAPKDPWGPPPFAGKGFLMVDDPWHRVWVWFDERGVMHKCDQTLIDPLLEDIDRRRKAVAGKRWGEGQVVASFPLDMYYRDIVPAKQNGDIEFIKRRINDPDYSKLRIKEGRI